jgi:hypothetical protein
MGGGKGPGKGGSGIPMNQSFNPAQFNPAQFGRPGGMGGGMGAMPPADQAAMRQGLASLFGFNPTTGAAPTGTPLEAGGTGATASPMAATSPAAPTTPTAPAITPDNQQMILDRAMGLFNRPQMGGGYGGGYGRGGIGSLMGMRSGYGGMGGYAPQYAQMAARAQMMGGQPPLR